VWELLVRAREHIREPNGLTPGGDLVAALRSQIHQVHRLLDEQVSAAAVRAQASSAQPSEILSLYVHAVCVEDITVNVLLREKLPLFTSVWINGQLRPWDLLTVHAYAEVVYAATDVLLNGLTQPDLRCAIDLRAADLGQPDVSWVLNRFVLWETAMICGELATTSVAWSRGAVSPRAEPVHAVTSPNGRANGTILDFNEEPQTQNTRSQSFSRSRRRGK
jgi:hypothetical protein